MTRENPVSNFIRSGSGKLHVTSHGSPHRPAVLLLHGLLDHGRSWDRIAQALSASYYVIAPDLHGHGDSQHLQEGLYSNSGWVLDLADVIAAFSLERIALVGHSLGGNICLRYASAFPHKVSALVSIEGVELPSVRRQRENPRTFPELLADWIEEERAVRERRPRRYADRSEGVNRLKESHPTLPAELIDELAEHGMERQSDGTLQWKYDNRVRVRAPDDPEGRNLDQMLASLRCPTLLCYGSESWIPLPPAERLDLIADCRIETFQGAGHWLHQEQTGRFIQTISAFLSGALVEASQGHIHA